MRHFASAAIVALITPAILLALPLQAHDKPVKGPNGGQLIHVEDSHYELVARNNELTLFVSDNDQKPRPTLEGAKGTATVLAGSKTVTIELKPASADMLKGSGTFVAGKGLKAVVSLQEPGRKPAQVRFTPLD